MFYIATKFGFVYGFVKGETYEGEQVLKATHCIDLRQAQPFPSYKKADQAFKKTYNSEWWYCIVNSEHKDDTKNDSGQPANAG